MSAAPLLALLAACVSAEYQREIVLAPVSSGSVAALRPGESDLGECLAALGAPNFVWERRGDSIALAYASYRDAGWGLGVSVQLARGVSASFDYGQLEAKSRGYVLLFDADWRLEGVRAGFLRDLRDTLERPPPQALE